MKLQTLDPFSTWQEALQLDSRGELEESKSLFAKAAKLFFEFGSGTNARVGRALFEYSSLMDAFASVQTARDLHSKKDYDGSLIEFAKAAETLRATIHFGFLSGYVSGCAILEEAIATKEPDEAHQAFKNANALFEQSKLALGLRDEKHLLIDVIDSLLKYSISRAFLAESSKLSQGGRSEEARIKTDQSLSLKKDHESLASKSGLRPYLITYFPSDDWKRAQSTGFIVTFPENDSIWAGNVGCNPVEIISLGDKSVNIIVNPFQSISYPVDSKHKGRIRIVYRDLKESKSYDEGCLLMI